MHLPNPLTVVKVATPTSPRCAASATGSWISFVVCAVTSFAPLEAQSVAWSTAGANDGAAFGIAIAGGVDIDLDGIPDALVGAPRFHPSYPGPGDASLLSGATGQRLFTWTGIANGDQFGAAVAIVGDVNGDGRADLAIGSPRADVAAANAGAVRVVSGRTGAELFVITGSGAGDLLGTSLAALGDVDGDTRADFAVGATRGSTGVGYVRIVSGAGGATLRTFVGTSVNDRFGVSLAAIGDLDLDGVTDLAIGAERSDVAATDAGSVLVISSATGTTLRSWFGATALDEFGHAVAGVGDLSADGVPDVLVGAWNADAGSGFLPGSVSLISGANGSVLGLWSGITADDHLGKGLAGLGDVNGDGVPDFGYSSRHDLNDQHPGNVWVRSGATHELLFFLWGDRIEDELGFGLAKMGDVDGDGLGDFMVGAPEAYHTTPDEGYARLILGCRGRVVPITPGCPGGPAYPRLFVRGCPGPGATLELTISEALPLSSARIRVGLFGGETHARVGCTQLVVPPLAGSIALVLDGKGRGATTWIVPAGLPSGTKLFIEASIRVAGVSVLPMRTNVVEIQLP